MALVEGTRTVCISSHERENAHGESILPLIERVLAEAGWSRSALDRIAVGVGPGSFTGLRVGIAIAQGISEGLEVPLIGVGSLEAMAWAAPGEPAASRCPVLDARRDEMFFALYSPEGRELAPPQLARSASDLQRFTTGFGGPPLFLGCAPALLQSIPGVFRSPETDLPHARWTALAAAQAPSSAEARPIYIREAVLVVPRLPPNPLSADHPA